MKSSRSSPVPTVSDQNVQTEDFLNEDEDSNNSSDAETCRTEFSRKLKEFCDSSTLHGVSGCYNATTITGRLFWLSAFFTALILAVYGCYEIIRQYEDSPVVISYIVHREDETTKQLPNIVVCPFNRFNISFFRANQINNDLIEYLQTPFRINTPYRYYWANKVKEKENQKSRNTSALDESLRQVMLRLGNISFEELIERASFPCHSIIDYCVNASKGIFNCCETAVTVMTPQSKCYRLQGTRQVSSGFGFGMTVVIRTPNEDQMAPGINLLHNKGVAIKIAEVNKGLDSDLTFVPTGVHALMPLKSTRYEFMSDPPRYDCAKPVSNAYSFSDCVDECIFRNATAFCHCRLLITNQKDPNGRPYPPCTPYEQRKCFNPAVAAAMKRPTYFSDCKTKCKQPCDYWTYQPTISYAKFPAKTFFEYTPESNDLEWSQYIILDIFYEKLEYTIIKHYPSMPNVTFIANLGGQVGLWIGGSILSIAQVVCFLGNLLRIGVNKLSRLHKHLWADSPPTDRNANSNGQVKLKKAENSRSSPSFTDVVKPLNYSGHKNSSQRLIPSGTEDFWQLRRSRSHSELVPPAPPNNNSAAPVFCNCNNGGLTNPLQTDSLLVHRNLPTDSRQTQAAARANSNPLANGYFTAYV